MCGICGFYGFNNNVLLNRMVESLEHRGPDDSGTYIDENINLGMRRLSIIDITNGNQPIHNEDESIWIVFNGEIYNFVELRRVLEEKGHVFYTDADTEVIIHAYEEFGENCVKLFQGMFAFAIWDSNEKKLFLARDKFGIKPLYFTKLEDKLFFGSEIKSILSNEEFVPSINNSSIHDFLSYLYVPPPKTIFNEVYKLEPAHTLTYKEDKIKIKRYWDLDCSSSHKSEDFYINKTRKLLEKAVSSHMVGDVPVGVYLSGGLDSSVITGLMSQYSDQNIKTFTVGFEDEEFSEINYARIVSDHFETDHHEIIVEADAFKILPKIVRQHDEPFGNPTSIIHYLISEKISKDVKVALSGTGGDEVFAGYPKYLGMKLSSYYSKVPGILRKNIIEKILFSLPESMKETDYVRWGKMFAKASHLEPAERYFSMINYFDEDEKYEMYSEEFRKEKFENSFNYINGLFNELNSINFEQRTLYAEINSFLPNNILEYTDKTSMAASLEARVPFLNPELVEFLAKVPFKYKIKGLELKYLLKKATEDIIPKSIIKRRKMGFNPPTGLWINRDLKDLVNEYLSQETIEKRGYFDYSFVEKMLKQHNKGKENLGLKLYSLIFLEEWHRLYIDSDR